MALDVTILGSGVTAPNQRRAEPGHHVAIDGASILFDGGSGTLHRMVSAGIDPFELTHVFYTHLHTDHVSDMAPLLFSLRNTPGRHRARDLVLTGPVDFRDYHDTLRRLSGGGRWWDTPEYDVVVRETRDRAFLEGAFSIRSLPMNHMEGRGVGYRLEDASGRVFAFSGDTGPCDEIAELGRKADLLLLECSFPDTEPRDGHLTPSRCARIARAAEPEHLVLVHMYPSCEAHDLAAEVGRVWGGRVTVAQDGARFRA
ncbi:MAG: MBL fold metallo-hydrolase [Acidobacteriota bacterium]